MTLSEQPHTIASGELRLEAMLHEGGNNLAALVLHPHPQYGGDMDNHVVIGACDALAGIGATTLRFNFRGTGASDGSFDGGRGEADDARAVFAELKTMRPHARIVLAGYSFGAMVAAAIAAETMPAALVLISPPVGMAQLATLPQGVPALLVTGERDAIAPPEAVRAYGVDGVQVRVVAGADHGWWPGLDALTDAIRVFLGGFRSP